MESDKKIVVCDSCFNLEEASGRKEAKYNCGKCGREVDSSFADEMANFVFSLGRGSINNGTAMAIIKRMEDMTGMMNFRMKLNIPDGGITFDAVSGIIEADFVSGGKISPEAVYQQGFYVLNNLVNKQKERFKKSTGMDFDRKWISAILRHTYQDRFIRGKPQFGYIITQKLNPKLLGKSFLLYPEIIAKSSSTVPVMPEDLKLDMIREGKVEAFKKIYDLYFLGNGVAALSRLKNNTKCCVAEVAVFEAPAVLLLPEKRRAYIFHC